MASTSPVANLLRSVLASVVVAVLFGLTGSSARAQRKAPVAQGHPDLQGMWLNDTATPLERPRAFGDKATLTDAEAREYEQRYQLDRTAAISPVDPVFELQAAGDLDTYTPGRLLPGNRTALITDPPDGHIPALTPSAQRRLSDATERFKTHYAENPENFPNTERCIIMANASAPPMLPVFYNNNVQIVETRDYVVILSEMIHDARIIPLDGRPHLRAGIGQWAGNSIGHWERDALVIDTTNFTEKTSFRGSGPRLHIVERLSLHGPDSLRYQFTVDDPESFVRPWSGESEMSRTEGRMFEYACHEGNYSLPSVMRGMQREPLPR
jgi:hypothetical protein